MWYYADSQHFLRRCTKLKSNISKWTLGIGFLLQFGHNMTSVQFFPLKTTPPNYVLLACFRLKIFQNKLPSLPCMNYRTLQTIFSVQNSKLDIFIPYKYQSCKACECAHSSKLVIKTLAITVEDEKLFWRIQLLNLYLKILVLLYHFGFILLNK